MKGPHQLENKSESGRKWHPATDPILVNDRDVNSSAVGSDSLQLSSLEVFSPHTFRWDRPLSWQLFTNSPTLTGRDHVFHRHTVAFSKFIFIIPIWSILQSTKMLLLPPTFRLDSDFLIKELKYYKHKYSHTGNVLLALQNYNIYMLFSICN